MKNQVSAEVAAFLAKGGKVEVVEAGVETGAVKEAYRRLAAQEAGYSESYTEYSMRQGEMGNPRYWG